MAENQQYVTLGVAEEVFAAPVEQGPGNPGHAPHRTPAPGPANLLGMIDVRGQGVPVLDLRLTLGIEPKDDTENTRIIVLSIDGADGERRLGLRTDRVFEVTVLDEAELDPPPSISGAWSGRCIAGIGRRNGRFVTVLDLDRLLGAAQALAPQAA